MQIKKAIKQVGVKIKKAFGSGPVTTYTKKTPVSTYKPSPKASPTGMAGDSGTFGSQADMDAIYRKRRTSEGYTTSKK